MWKRFKRGGILVPAIGALMLIEGLTIEEPLAVAQNTNSSPTIQNSNSKPRASERKPAAAAGDADGEGGARRSNIATKALAHRIIFSFNV